MPLADARWGANSRSAPDPEAFVVLHSGAIPEMVEGVSSDPSTTTVAHGIGEAYVSPPARTAVREVTYYTRPMHWRSPWNNGMHGVVKRLRPTVMDARQTPFLRPARTLRSAPVGPWDVGTALGPTGRPSGAE